MRRINSVKLLIKLLTATALVVSFATLTDATTKVAHLDIQEYRCLVKNIYHEARGEPFAGKVAVARVTLNRSTTQHVCKTVFAKNQFSWTAGKYLPYNKIPEDQKYEAHHAIHAALIDTSEYDHFHATYVKPYWSRKFTRIKQIGNHIFYKSK